MKTNHQRGFVAQRDRPRELCIESKTCGRSAGAFEPQYDGNRTLARAKHGAKHYLNSRDRQVLKTRLRKEQE